MSEWISVKDGLSEVDNVFIGPDAGQALRESSLDTYYYRIMKIGSNVGYVAEGDLVFRVKHRCVFCGKIKPAEGEVCKSCGAPL